MSMLQGILYEEPSAWLFLLVTVVMGGWAGWMAGRGIARAGGRSGTARWRCSLVAAAVRFIHFALFTGTLLSLHYYAVDAVVVMIIGAAGYRYTRTRQMTTPVPLALRADLAADCGATQRRPARRGEAVPMTLRPDPHVADPDTSRGSSR